MKDIFLITLLLILLTSCSDRKLSDDSFFITSDFRHNSLGFISASNQDGTILYDTVGQDLRKDIEFQTFEDDIIDVTIGFESSNSFSINTYRNVQSGFVISNSFNTCGSPFTNSFGSDKTVTLEIEGIDSYEKLFIPFDYVEQTSTNSQENKITITGRVNNDNDLMITVLTIDNEYKSIYFRDEDFVNQGANEFKATININDFVSPIIHEINLGKNHLWMVVSELLTFDQRVVSLSKWNTYEHYQEGEKIKLFLVPGFNFDLLRLSVKNGNILNGYQYSKIITEIPTEISFFDPIINVKSISDDDYDINIDDNFELLKVEYLYKENAWLSIWNIYERNVNSKFDRKLPEIPIAFLNETTILKDNISNPIEWVAHSFQVEDKTKLDSKFNMANISRDLDCFAVNCKFIGDKF